jgi:uncharacterized protein YegP (UPF0339 family)
MAGKFDLKKSTSGKYFFNLKAGNGQTVLTSEMYESKGGAIKGIDSVKRNAPDDNRYERKTSTTNNEPYFVLKAGNGEPIGRSENYSSFSAMENGIVSVKENAASAATEDNSD